MQKIIFFVEPSDDAFVTSEKIGNLFMNLSAIEEDSSSEILEILELGKSSFEVSYPDGENYQNFVKERQQKGMDHFIE